MYESKIIESRYIKKVQREVMTEELRISGCYGKFWIEWGGR